VTHEPTHLDIFRAAHEHRGTGRILYYAKFTPAIEAALRRSHDLATSASLAGFYGMFSPVLVSPKRRPERGRPDFSGYYADIEKPPGWYIGEDGVFRRPGSLHHFQQIVSPLRNARSIEEIRAFPDTVDPADYDYSGMAEEVRAAHGSGRVASCWVGRLYETSWPVRGYQEFLVDMVDAPERAEVLLDRHTRWNLELSRRAAEAGVDQLCFGDDVANQRTLMFSPALWRRMLKPRWSEIISAARAVRPDIAAWYHSDGNITDILDDLVEVGFDMLNPVQPECMDVREVKRRYGSRLVIDGGLGTQGVMPFGTPGDVRREVGSLVETAGRDGGLILSPSHSLEPEVPLANIAAFFDAARTFGGWA
jgi:uroporphyrinogen decarboxylase